MIRVLKQIISLSDIHLGHNRTSTEFIIKNLDDCITNSNTLSNVDLLILAGDIFDKGLAFASEDISKIIHWINRLMLLCNKHNVVLRILEGTPSHDRKQSKIFTDVNEILSNINEYKLDFKYVDTLSIEHINEFGINVLYIPDEWNTDSNTTLLEVKELLNSKQLNQVDYAIIHGCFEHQLPSHIGINIKHNNNEYNRIVKHLIFIGHIHQHSIKDKIISHGSFDRLSHGEEEKKGYIKVIIDKNNYHNVKFIENKKSKKYITIKLDNDITDTIISNIDIIVSKLPSGSYIRLNMDRDDLNVQLLQVLEQRHPTINWSIQTNKQKEEQIVLEKKEYIPLIINRNNINQVVMNKVSKQYTDLNIVNNCNNILTEILEL